MRGDEYGDDPMRPMAIVDWHLYLKDGEKYLQTALGGAEKRARIFTPEILYNISAWGSKN